MGKQIVIRPFNEILFSNVMQQCGPQIHWSGCMKAVSKSYILYDSIYIHSQKYKTIAMGHTSVPGGGTEKGVSVSRNTARKFPGVMFPVFWLWCWFHWLIHELHTWKHTPKTIVRKVNLDSSYSFKTVLKKLIRANNISSCNIPYTFSALLNILKCTSLLITLFNITMWQAVFQIFGEIFF